MTTVKVLVIGGGLVGLCISWELAKRGCTVTVVDSGRQGQASWAAAGMLAPLAESTDEHPLLPYGVESLRRWTEFAGSLKNVCPDFSSIQGSGMLRVARSARDEETLQAAFIRHKDVGLPLDELSGGDARALEPSLSRDVRYAVRSPAERSVNPRDVLVCLHRACLNLGVTILELDDSVHIRSTTGSIECVSKSQKLYTADEYVVCSGAWSKKLLGQIGCTLPIAPVKGQVAQFDQIAPSPINHTIFSSSGYLVPRSGSGLIAGATVERVGFDSTVTDEGIDQMAKMARELIPELRIRRITGRWAGLRPVSRDGLPIVGRITNFNNLSVAVGHGRNGILYSPITADMVADYITNERRHSLPNAFSASRFN